MSLLTFLHYVLAFQIGWLAGWVVFDYSFYRPLRKNYKEAIKGWGEANNLTAEILAKAGYQVKKEDGSVLSPIQMKP